MDLFDYALTTNHVPLAERMRPEILDDFIAQKHILGKGTLLRKLIENDCVSSIILQGPPAFLVKKWRLYSRNLIRKCRARPL